jgi:hypothetical protein
VDNTNDKMKTTLMTLLRTTLMIHANNIIDLVMTTLMTLLRKIIIIKIWTTLNHHMDNIIDPTQDNTNNQNENNTIDPCGQY